MAPTQSLPSLPITYRARNLLIWAIGFSILLVIAAIFGWFAFDPEIRAMFRWFQVATLILIGLVLIGFMMGLGMSIVRADERGLTIRNAIVVRSYAWDEIGQVQFRQGDPWAYITLGTERDAVRRQMIGVQSTDGARAHQAVRELRALHAHYTGR